MNTPGTVTLVLPPTEELPATWLAESVWAASAVPAPPKARAACAFGALGGWPGWSGGRLPINQ